MRLLGWFYTLPLRLRSLLRPIPAFGIGWLYPVCLTGNASPGRVPPKTVKHPDGPAAIDAGRERS